MPTYTLTWTEAVTFSVEIEAATEKEALDKTGPGSTRARPRGERKGPSGQGREVADTVGVMACDMGEAMVKGYHVAYCDRN